MKRHLLRTIVAAMEPSEHLRPAAYKMLWVVSFALALAGGLLYVITSAGWSWWLGWTLGMPLILLVIEKMPPGSGGNDFSGPMGPP